MVEKMSNKIFYAKDIASYLSTELIGKDIIINNICSVDKIHTNSVSFITKLNYQEKLSVGALIIVGGEYEILNESVNSYIKVENPRSAFAKIIEKFFYKRKSGISKKASIAITSKIGDNCYIGDNVVIEDGVHIGCNTIIDHNTVILNNSVIGKNCNIGSNCVIGNDGLSTAKDNNLLITIRHLGNVIIEDNVEIGASSTVGRGTLNNTIIKNGTKVGPQVNIGHNSIIGRNCQIAGRTHISGSVKIGEESHLWANSIIKDGITIGSKCTIGIGAVVTKNVEDNITVMGLEAVKLKNLVKFKNTFEYK